MTRICVLAIALSALLLGGCEPPDLSTWRERLNLPDLSAWARYLPWREPADDGLIHLSGTVEAREVDLAFQVAGRIESLHADEGDVVREDELVAVLDARDYELAVQRARHEAQAARASLEALRAGTRPQALRAAGATLSKAQADLAYARSEVERIRELVRRKLTPEDQLSARIRQLDVARAAVEEARENLALLREGPRKEDIERAAAEYAARQAALETAAQQLDYTELHSRAGGVVSVRLAEQGEVVQPGQPVLRIARLDRPWVRAWIAESDLSRVRLGQRAQVRVDGQPGETLRGRLTFISPEAEFTPKTVETQELRVDLVYRIKIEIDNRAGMLKLGMPADVTLEPAAGS